MQSIRIVPAAARATTPVTGNGANFQNGQASSFPVTGVVALAAAGTIRIECISSNAVAHNVGAHVVAVTVADIVNAP